MASIHPHHIGLLQGKESGAQTFQVAYQTYMKSVGYFVFRFSLS